MNILPPKSHGITIGDGKPGGYAEYLEGSDDRIVVVRNRDGSPAVYFAAADYIAAAREARRTPDATPSALV